MKTVENNVLHGDSDISNIVLAQTNLLVLFLVLIITSI